MTGFHLLRAKYSENSEPEPVSVVPASFTQQQVDSFLAKARRADADRIKDLDKRLQEIASSGLTPESQKALQDALEQERTDRMSHEERLRLTHAKAIEKLTAESNTWKTQFEQEKNAHDTTIRTNMLLGAAGTNDVYSPAQLVSLFGNSSKVVDIVDSTTGKPTGQKQLELSIQVDGKSVSGPIGEVLTLMKGSSEYANLFKSNGTGGFGGKGNSATNRATFREDMTMAEFVAMRNAEMSAK